MTNYAAVLSEYTADLKFSDLPSEVVEQVILLILQTIGASLASLPIKQAKDAINMVKKNGGIQEEVVESL